MPELLSVKRVIASQLVNSLGSTAFRGAKSNLGVTFKHIKQPHFQIRPTNRCRVRAGQGGRAEPPKWLIKTWSSNRPSR